MPVSKTEIESLPSLYIFNPDTEYALANGTANYTPSAAVVKLRRNLALLPSLYASEGDSILISDPVSDAELAALPYHDIAVRKNLELIVIPGPHQVLSLKRIMRADPWGWNLTIASKLSTHFENLVGIPSDSRLEDIRRLSHRRFTIDFLKFLMEKSDWPEVKLPCEFDSLPVAMALFEKHDDLFFKAPWSSSGRGVMRTNDLTEKHVAPWVKGIIATQGSVMAETAYDRELDFATEWRCRSGEVSFIGYSVFKTSRRGKYHGNIEAPQSDLLQMIENAAPGWNDNRLHSIKEAIEALIAPCYDGPLGIDMLATREGNVNPCVEINLRRTMGLVAIENGS